MLAGPPGDQVLPAQPAVFQRLVVHQAILLVLDDADGVSDGVRQHDLRLAAVGGEDEVLQLPETPCRPIWASNCCGASSPCSSTSRRAIAIKSGSGLASSRA